MAKTLKSQARRQPKQRRARQTVEAVLDAAAMRRKELTLLNVRRSNHETDEALELLGAQAAWFAPLLTHTREIERIDEAFKIASQYKDGVGKMMVRP